MSKNKLIPKQFSLGGKTFKIKRNDGIDYDMNRRAEFDPGRQEINLAYKLGNEVMHEELVEQSFYHELVHAILKTLNRETLNKDEDFVDNFATMLHQYMKTKK